MAKRHVNNLVSVLGFWLLVRFKIWAKICGHGRSAGQTVVTSSPENFENSSLLTSLRISNLNPHTPLFRTSFLFLVEKSESVSSGVWCVPGFGAGFEITFEPSELQREKAPGEKHFHFLRQTLVCTHLMQHLDCASVVMLLSPTVEKVL